jgi:hypothetical protein
LEYEGSFSAILEAGFPYLFVLRPHGAEVKRKRGKGLAGGVSLGVLGAGLELQGEVEGLGGFEDPLHPDPTDHVYGRGVEGESVFAVDGLAARVS